MNEFTVHTAEHLPALLQGFRKQAGLTQSDMAKRLGITQQTLSAFERNADKAGADRLLEYLSILGIELVLRQSQDRKQAGFNPEADW
ncbi:MAG: helix-turn-helix domain-containing protein [Burkholderiaceae bacterium]|nr:helix-turn-helix domain-containing protein [Burkholderiaceae bacterium]